MRWVSRSLRNRIWKSYAGTHRRTPSTCEPSGEAERCVRQTEAVAGDEQAEVVRVATEEDARAEVARRNAQPRDWGWSHWFFSGPHVRTGDFAVMRMRGVGPDDVPDARAYESRLREIIIERIQKGLAARAPKLPPSLRIAELGDVTLGGWCPETVLSIVFRRGSGGWHRYRKPVWPAEYRDPDAEARQYLMYILEGDGEPLATTEDQPRP